MTEDVANRPRRPWLAFLLAYLRPGLGHLYAGEPRAAVGWNLVELLVFSLGLSTAVLAPGHCFGALETMLLSVVLLRLVQATLALLLARRRREYGLAPFNRLRVYVLFAAVSAAVQLGVALAAKSRLLETFRGAHGMEPSIRSRDVVVALKAGPGRSLRRGDVVVYQHAAGQRFIKRVVGLDGEELEIDDRTVRINAASLALTPCTDPKDLRLNRVCRLERTPEGRSYPVLFSDTRNGQREPVARFRIPPGSVYLLGDDRDQTLDSRVWGPVPEGGITSHVVNVLVSITTERGLHFGWDRAGQRL